MQPVSQVADVHEVIVDTPFLDESTLSIGNEVGHVKSKAGGHHLNNDLCNSMNKTYGPKVGYVLCPSFLGMRAMLAELSQCRLETRRAEKLLITCIISGLTMSQHSLKKAPVKPSGPGALSLGRS